MAIARAHLAAPDLLVLDEATSAVDPATERRLTVALDSLAAGRTTVTIAHRLKAAEDADDVIVVDAGRVVAARHPRRARTRSPASTPSCTPPGWLGRRSSRLTVGGSDAV